MTWPSEDDQPAMRDTDLHITIGRHGIVEATTDGTVRIETATHVIEIGADSITAWMALLGQVAEAVDYWWATPAEARVDPGQQSWFDLIGRAAQPDRMRSA